MKRTIFSLYFSFFIFHFSLSQDLSDLELFEQAMKPGAVLTYDVTMSDKKYQFIVTIKKIGDEIAFDWKMSEPVNKTGSVTMSTSAVSKADALFNYFNGGESKLEKETSVFVSKKIVSDVEATTQTSIKINGAEDTATVMSNTISDVGFVVNGNFVSIPGWELLGGSEIKYTVVVLESARFPLIYRMDLGWKIQLAEIKNP